MKVAFEFGNLGHGGMQGKLAALKWLLSCKEKSQLVGREEVSGPQKWRNGFGFLLQRDLRSPGMPTAAGLVVPLHHLATAALASRSGM